MTSFSKKATTMCCQCMTVETLNSILTEYIKGGFGKSEISFRLGQLKGHKTTAITLPISSIKESNDKKTVILSPNPEIPKVKGKHIPNFDFSVSFDDEAMKVEFK